MESNLDRISFLGVDCLFSQQSQAKVKSPGASEHFQNKWGQAYAVHTVSFDWFLSGLEFGVLFTKTFDILPEIIMEYQI